jgi:REP element-mobilizing transposase RayT
MNRIEYENSFHHVIDRGYLKKTLFYEKNDFEYFLGLLWSVCESHSLIIHSYCLMPNHFHLLLQNPLKNISKAMHLLLLRYAIYFNHRYQQKGKVFERQFLSPIVDTENYLVGVSKYIHRNPLEIVEKNLFEWPWSSCKYFINPRLIKPKYLETSLILSKFSKSPKSFLDFVLESTDWNPEQTFYSNTILGTNDFIRKIAIKHLDSRINTDIKDSFKIKKVFQDKFNELKQHILNFDTDLRTQEALAVYAFKTKTNLTYKEISKMLFAETLSNSSLISKIKTLKKRSQVEPELAEMIHEIDNF